MYTKKIKEKLKELMGTIAQIKKMHALLMGENLASFNITFDQWVVLNIIDQHGPIPAKTVAELSGKDSSTITRVLDQLERKELIEREKNKKDRRSIIIHLNEQAKEIAKFIHPVEEAIFTDSIKNISVTEITNAVDGFKKILTNQQGIAKKREITS